MVQMIVLAEKMSLAAAGNPTSSLAEPEPGPEPVPQACLILLTVPKYTVPNYVSHGRSSNSTIFLFRRQSQNRINIMRFWLRLREHK
jgi:hypothetical protein